MSNPMESPPAVLAGRYRIRREIGRGGTAVVYLADDAKHKRQVAVKILHPHLAAALGADRFLREIEISARLTHPHILMLLDSGQEEGLLYLVTPYVAGDSLRSLLRRKHQLPVHEAVRIAMEVADALDYAHGEGVVHRDLKAENVLLTPEHALLTDFGLARAIDAAETGGITRPGVAIGTPEYMSPEQASGRSDLDGRSDVYSLGCVLYEMLLGEPPFTGATAQAVLAKHQSAPPLSLRLFRDTVPEGLDSLVARALAKFPADRFPSAGAMRAALARVVLPSGEHPTGAGAEAPMPLRAPRFGGRGLRWAGALLLVTGVLAGGWLLMGHGTDGLDPNKVVVFPLDNRGAPGSEGEDAALMMVMALEHTEPLRAIDGWDRLGEDERRDPSSVTVERARRISERVGAGYFVTGAIVRHADSLSVALRLYDTRGDSLYAQTSAGRPSAQVRADQVGLLAAVQLLPSLLDPGRPLDLTPITERDPAAIANWIQGEQRYRRSRFLEALPFYRRAVELDSLLAFAALKGAQAASWEDRLDEARALADRAQRVDSLLPLRHRHFVRGLRSYLAGRADSAETHLRAALGVDPEWSEAWMVLGEVHHHLLPSSFVPDSTARVAFQQAARFDEGFSPPLTHLAEYLVRDGAHAEVETLLSRFRRLDPSPVLVRRLELMLGCASGRATDWREAVASDTLSAFLAGRSLAVGAAHVDCADAAFRSILEAEGVESGLRWGAFLGRFALLAARGRRADATALARQEASAGTPFALALPVLATLAGVDMEDEALEFERFVKEVMGEAYEGLRQPHTIWLMSAWHASRGDTSGVSALARRLSPAQGLDPRPFELVRQASAAHLALARGDTAAALQRLLELRPTAPRDVLEWELQESLPVERLMAARLLLGAGRFAEAHRAASFFDHPQPAIYVLFVPESLRIREAAARGWGRPLLAESARNRLARLEAPQRVARR